MTHDPRLRAETCAHLKAAREDVPPGTDGCAACLARGDTWVRLRACLTCGAVGCCDDSPNRHATQHFHQTQHPVVRSVEPGEDWLWCYHDRLSTSAGDLQRIQAALRRQPLLAGLPDADLERLYGLSRVVFVLPGDVLMEEGAPGEAMYLILDGEVEVTKRKDGQQIPLAVRRAGEFLGEMALLEDAPRYATVRAVRESRLLEISKQAFTTLVQHPEAALAMLHAVTSRLRGTEAVLMQQEKLAALGKLSAGIAHEINNPAAAIGRAAAHLADALATLESAGPGGAGNVEPLLALREAAEQRRTAQGTLGTLQQAEAEEAVQAWLEDRDVPEPWRLAPDLVSAGWDPDLLDEVAALLVEADLDQSLRWLAASGTARALTREIGASAAAISDIVQSVKGYTYMDQAPVQDVDIHHGLDSTLAMLRHKLRSGIQVRREYAPDLPRIEARGSELNQVWTNLVDNALDAMGETGTLTLRTWAEPEGSGGEASSGGAGGVGVEICDSGPGIPPEQQDRVFEQFFTTKPQGKGTGLGLHLAHNIVVYRHHGQIRLSSEPGRTCFQVVLPRRLTPGP